MKNLKVYMLDILCILNFLSYSYLIYKLQKKIQNAYILEMQHNVACICMVMSVC